MRVVSAGMHTPFMFRGEGKACLLFDRQRVHVCTERNGLSTGTAADLRYDPTVSSGDRGLIREGMTADLVLLRPERLPDELTEDASRGISKVWVRGRLNYDSDPYIDLNGRPKTKFFGISMGN